MPQNNAPTIPVTEPVNFPSTLHTFQGHFPPPGFLIPCIQNQPTCRAQKTALLAHLSSIPASHTHHALDTAQVASPGIGSGFNLALASIDNSFGPIPAPLDKACNLPKPRVGPSYFERKRAELVARKARHDALMALRVGSEKYGRRWPRFRQIAEDKENAHRAVEFKRKQDLAAREQAAKAALVRKEERAAADARVAVLMRQRTSGRRARGARVVMFGRLSSSQSEIAWRANSPTHGLSRPGRRCFVRNSSRLRPHTHFQLLRLSFSTYPRIRALLYQHISVGDQAGALVRTLANESCLPPMVRTLTFRSSLCAYIADAEWALLLPAMVNLRRLVIANHVPLERRVLPSITFRLRSFISLGVVVGAWAEFLQLQPDLEEIAFHGDLFGPAPGPAHLPMLRSVTGRPEDVARFVRYHQLDDVWVRSGSPWGYRTFKTIDIRHFSLSPSRLLTLRIMAPQLLFLMRGAPAGLATILHLTLDEDQGWCRFGPESTIFKVVRELRDHTPALRSLTLVCSPDTPRMNTHPSILIAPERRCTPKWKPILLSGSDFSRHTQNLTATPQMQLLLQAPPASCESCVNGVGEFQCSDCPLRKGQCAACIKRDHKMRPLHQIEHWNGRYFERTNLRQLGLQLQLGHGLGGDCPAPGEQTDLSVITRHGVQPLGVVYCACDHAQSRSTQLIDAGLLPAGSEPEWAVTFGVAADLAYMRFGGGEDPGPVRPPEARTTRRQSVPLAAEMPKRELVYGDENGLPSESWLAMVADLQAWASEWRKVPASSAPAGMSGLTGSTTPERQGSPPPLHKTLTSTGAAVAAAIAAAADSPDADTLITEAEKSWERVMKCCMDALRESERRAWLWEIEEQERMLAQESRPPTRRRRINEPDTPNQRRRLAAVEAATAEITSDDEGWADYSTSSEEYVDV
ncbi:hypothetical protein FB451DRAFT_1443155 [Mycena latifolia]|nr:hypothetical protein FB451DRAFT_1443155 [Mycena latifolia]